MRRGSGARCRSASPRRAPELINLALRLEDRLGIDEAIVVPSGDGVEGAAKAVGAALGAFLSETISDNMRAGRLGAHADGGARRLPPAGPEG